MKTIIISICFLIICSGVLFSQDTTFNKPITTKKFDLSVKYIDSLVYNPSIGRNQIVENLFEDCYKVIPISESKFSLRHESGVDNIFYKDIKEITFKGKNSKGEGIFLGTTCGLITGLITTMAFLGNSKKSGEEAFGNFIYPMTLIPIFTTLGFVIGWKIGANTYDRETYNISNYSSDKRKEQYLKLIHEHQVDF